jgi:transposase
MRCHIGKNNPFIVQETRQEVITTIDKRRVKMKFKSYDKSREIRQDTLIVGVDIGSVSHTAYLTTISGKNLGSLRFFNNRRGFDELWSLIMRAKQNGGCRDILLGFESTGSYGEPLQHYLLQKPVKLVQVNPMHTKRAKDICDNSPLKSDDKDSRVIADIIRLGRWISLVVPEGVKADLRVLTRIREKHVRDLTVEYNQLRHQHGRIFPEFCGIIRDIKCKTAQYLIAKYPTPEDYDFLRVEELCDELRKVSRGKFGKKQAEALRDAANSSIGIKEGIRSILFDIRGILSKLKLMNGLLAEVEDEIRMKLEKVPESKNILSIKGIGVITAAGIIGEVADFSCFRTSSEVQKFAGLNLFEISSGLHKGQVHITKVGRALLRKILYFAALNTVRKGGIMHDYYDRLTSRGMVKTKALIAVARKLLRTIFALVKNNTMFIENYQEIKYLKKAA